MNLFFRGLMALAIGLCFTIPAASAQASERDDVVAVIQGFFKALETNDMKTMTAAFTKRQSITDEFTPFYWEGEDAFAQWGKDFMADSTTHKVSEPVMKFGALADVRVVGNGAYVTAPATYDFKADGKAIGENGLFTFALEKTAEGWKIRSMVWGVTGYR